MFESCEAIVDFVFRRGKVEDSIGNVMQFTRNLFSFFPLVSKDMTVILIKTFDLQ